MNTPSKPSLASPGLLHLVETALRHPSAHAPADWPIPESAIWIMGFEHAMTMVQDYINSATTRTAEAPSRRHLPR